MQITDKKLIDYIGHLAKKCYLKPEEILHFIINEHKKEFLYEFIIGAEFDKKKILEEMAPEYNKLIKLYEFPDSQSNINKSLTFLYFYQDMFPVLYTLPSKLKEYINYNYLCIGYNQDPEYMAGSNLYLDVMHKIEDLDTAMNIQKKFDNEYWLKLYKHIPASRKICLDFHYFEN